MPPARSRSWPPAATVALSCARTRTWIFCSCFRLAPMRAPCRRWQRASCTRSGIPGSRSVMRCVTWRAPAPPRARVSAHAPPHSPRPPGPAARTPPQRSPRPPGAPARPPAAGGSNDFVRRLAQEVAERHARFGQTVYLLEPNVKSGEGGYRDLCVGLWAAKARFRVRDLAGLVTLGELPARRAAALAAAREFYLRVRTLAHLHARRRQDQLTFELQEAIAA